MMLSTTGFSQWGLGTSTQGHEVLRRHFQRSTGTHGSAMPRHPRVPCSPRCRSSPCVRELHDVLLVTGGSSSIWISRIFVTFQIGLLQKSSDTCKCGQSHWNGGQAWCHGLRRPKSAIAGHVNLFEASITWNDGDVWVRKWVRCRPKSAHSQVVCKICATKGCGTPTCLPIIDVPFFPRWMVFWWTAHCLWCSAPPFGSSAGRCLADRRRL